MKKKHGDDSAEALGWGSINAHIEGADGKPVLHWTSTDRTFDNFAAIGWDCPPEGYPEWRALLVAWVTHLHERYGVATAT